MTDRHHRAKQLFVEACGLPAGDRASFLVAACGDDVEMRREIECLLEADQELEESADDLFAGVAELLGGLARQSSEAAEPSLDPESLPRYRIVRKIGEGGMGVVYEAEQERPRRRVALKVLRTAVADDATRQRFRLETDVLGRLDHPGIARIYDAGAPEGAPYIAMELVSGVPLTEWGRGVSRRARLEALARIADAVHDAHEKGVVHRDLKPSNLFVDERGRCKVLDFGIARVAGGSSEHDSKTVTGQLLGTLAYMAPEQAMGRPSDLDRRADVYALGVLLYELIGGVRPLEVSGLPLPEALRRIREVTPEPLGGHDAESRGDLETVAAVALSKEPSKRYSSAEGFAADLRHVLADEPIQARSPTVWERSARFVRRHRALVSAATCVVLALSAATMISVKAARDARAARDLAEKEARLSALIRQFLESDVLGGADPRWGGRDLRVRDAVARGVERLGQRFEDDPALRSDLLSILGWTWIGLGEGEGALPLLRESERLATELYGSTSREAISVGARLGQALRATGAPDTDRFLRGLAERAEALPPGSFDRLHAFEQAAHGMSQSGDSALACALLQKAFEESRGSRRRYLGSLLAEVMLGLGDLEAASSLMDDVRASGAPLPEYGLAAVLRTDALLTKARGEWQAGLAQFEHLAGRVEAWLGVRSPMCVDALLGAGQCARQLGMVDVAGAHLERAAELAMEHLPPHHDLIARCRSTRALHWSDVGRHAEALAEFDALLAEDEAGWMSASRRLALGARRALVLARSDRPAAIDELRAVLLEDERDGGVTASTARSRVDLAVLLAKEGRTDQALTEYRAALGGLRATVGDAHPWTGQTANKYGLLLERAGAWADAEALFQESWSGAWGGDDGTGGRSVTAVNLSGLCFDQGRSLEARAWMERGRVAHASHDQQFLMRAVKMRRAEALMCSECGRFEDARASLEDAERLLSEAGHPRSVALCVDRARVEREAGDLALAWSTLESVPDVQLTASDALRMGRESLLQRWERGDLEEARRRALETERNAVQWRARADYLSPLRVDLAWLHALTGDLNSAALWEAKALEGASTNPVAPRIRWRLQQLGAWSASERGAVEEAVRLLDEAIGTAVAWRGDGAPVVERLRAGRVRCLEAGESSGG